jgi:hypothetical protein
MSAVSADMTIIISDIETIDVDDGEGDVESPKATVARSAGTPRRAASPGKQAVETPRQALKTQDAIGRAPIRWATLGRTRGRRRPHLSPASPASGQQPSKSRDLLPALLRVPALVLLFD